VTHAVDTVLPVFGLYVPDGHWVKIEDPVAQYEPAGHRPPIVEVVGVAVLDPCKQKYPCVQSPLGACKEVPLQYFPGVQFIGSFVPLGQ